MILEKWLKGLDIVIQKFELKPDLCNGGDTLFLIGVYREEKDDQGHNYKEIFIKIDDETEKVYLETDLENDIKFKG